MQERIARRWTRRHGMAAQGVRVLLAGVPDPLAALLDLVLHAVLLAGVELRAELDLDLKGAILAAEVARGSGILQVLPLRLNLVRVPALVVAAVGAELLLRHEASGSALALEALQGVPALEGGPIEELLALPPAAVAQTRSHALPDAARCCPSH
eukprot:9276395-Lingulodinium_polyedra.AAC.1